MSAAFQLMKRLDQLWVTASIARNMDVATYLILESVRVRFEQLLS